MVVLEPACPRQCATRPWDNGDWPYGPSQARFTGYIERPTDCGGDPGSGEGSVSLLLVGLLLVGAGGALVLVRRRPDTA